MNTISYLLFLIPIPGQFQHPAVADCSKYIECDAEGVAHEVLCALDNPSTFCTCPEPDPAPECDPDNCKIFFI